MDLAKKTVIITGASMGIGAGLAEALARRGANLVLAARSVDELAALAARCKAAGARAIAVPTDVADPNACERMVQAAAAEFGGVDVLVNNAGITMLGRFDEVTDLGLFERLMRVNYLGSVYCTHFALPLLKQSKGLLVAVTSLTGKTGVPTRTGYAASKHAMHGFFDSLRIELRGSGVDVLVVAPGSWPPTFAATPAAPTDRCMPRARAARARTCRWRSAWRSSCERWSDASARW